MSLALRFFIHLLGVSLLAVAASAAAEPAALPEGVMRVAVVFFGGQDTVAVERSAPPP